MLRLLIKRNHILLLYVVCLVFYILPVIFELLLKSSGVFGNAIWYAYVFPAILLGYHYGFKGGLFNCIFGTVLALAVEYSETHLYISNLEAAVDTMLMVGLTALMSVCIGYMVDILKEKEKVMHKLYEAATSDALTGLYNYGYFENKLKEEFEFTQKQQAPLTLLFLDIDRFKNYNDTYGHPAANLALRELARVLRESFRQTDIVARYGGDEFAIILPNTEKAEAETIVRRLMCRINNIQLPQGRISVSIGMATYPQMAQDISHLVQFSDIALYQAKRKSHIHFQADTSEGNPSC